MKRILSVFLIACLMLTMLVVSVPAIADGGPYTITFVQSGATIAPASYNEGAEIVYPAIDGKPNRQGDWVWSLSKTTFEAVPTVMPDENITVYAIVREGFFNFENYYRNDFITISGRVQPVELEDGNTVVKFDNNGIALNTQPFNWGRDNYYYTKEYVSGEAVYTQYDKTTAVFEAGKYYHNSAVDATFATVPSSMEAYNAIELGKIEAGKSYAITFSYKAESVVSAVKVEPVIACLSANQGRKLVSAGGLMTRYKDSIVTISSATDTWVTATAYITAPETIPSLVATETYLGDQLRLNVYTGVKDENTVVYFDDITVREFVGANLIYNYANGSKKTVMTEVGGNIDYIDITANRNGDMAWSAVQGAYVAPETVMPGSDYNVYEYFREGFFGFENYYRNQYITLAGRVQPVELEDGNTVVKFDNNGIALTEKPFNWGTDKNFYTKKYVDGNAVYEQYNKDTAVFEPGKYYHAAAKDVSTDTTTGMDTYNAIELGKIDDGAVYKITVNYKREKVEKPVTVSPRSWYLSANGDRKFQTFYSDANFVIPATDTPDTVWQTKTVYISAVTTNPSSAYALDQLRLVVYTPNEMDIDTVIYFDDITVEKITAPYIFFNKNNGEEAVLVRGEAGDTIVAPTLTQTNKEFLGWFTDVDCTTPFTLDKFAADTAVTVYAGWKTLPVITYDFENYNPNQYIAISGRVQPMKEASGNTVIKFDNNGMPFEEEPFFWGRETYIYTKEYVDGEAVYTKIEDPANTPFEPGKYYHASATLKATDATKSMEQYNAIELGTVEDGVIYKITVKYKRQNVITPVTVSPRSWRINANDSRSSQIVYDAKITIPATSTPDTEWQTATVYISGQTTNGEVTGLDTLRLVIYSANIIDENNVVYFDNITVEEISAPYIFFDGQNGETPVFVKGEAGETITAPKFTCFGKSFNGWFTDKECTKRFTLKTFGADTATTVYAGWVENRVRTYSFENYNIPESGTDGTFRRHSDVSVITTKDAYDGNSVMQFNRMVDGTYYQSRSIVAVAEGDAHCTLNPENDYIVTLYLKVVEKIAANSVGVKVFTAGGKNYGHDPSADVRDQLLSTQYSDFRTKTSSDWIMASYVIDGESMKENANYLYIKVSGFPELVWIDKVTVTAVKPGEAAVVVNNGGSDSITSAVLAGKVGENFASSLPKNPVISGKQFIGYYTMDSQGYYVPLAEADMKFDTTVYQIYARFVDKKVYQNFEDQLYHDFVNEYELTGPLNYDYELYNSRAAGNSKDNVTSGRYSLHRKGNSPYIENAQILRFGNILAEGQRYTVTMKVKLGKHKQTDGAVKFVSCRSHYFSWDTMGDYYAIAPIKDLKEGEWTEVSYTFNSVEAFVSIQTPGYVELFIDDITFTLVDENTPLSEDPEYTDYVQVLLDEEGNLLAGEGKVIDISSIICDYLTVGGSDNGISAATIILISAIGGGVVLLFIALAVVLIIVKRKKKKAKV